MAGLEQFPNVPAKAQATIPDKETFPPTPLATGPHHEAEILQSFGLEATELEISGDVFFLDVAIAQAAHNYGLLIICY